MVQASSFSFFLWGSLCSKALSRKCRRRKEMSETGFILLLVLLHFLFHFSVCFVGLFTIPLCVSKAQSLYS